MTASYKPSTARSVSYQQVGDEGSPPHRRAFYSGWYLEALAALVGFGCLTAVGVILGRMQDKPLDTWWFPFNINSTVAAFVTAAKSVAMMIVASSLSQRKWLHFQERPSRLRDLDVFDEASRGPFGSLKLIWCMRSRWNFAILGALVTIFALTVDTSAQQMVKIETRSWFSDTLPGSIWTTTRYMGGATVQDQAGWPTQAEPSTVDVKMEGAIFRGIYNTTSTMPFSCPTNCTWNDFYISLGVQSRCVNVTAETLANRTHIPDPTRNISSPELPWIGDSIVMTTPRGLEMHYNSSTEHYTVVDVVGKQLYKHIEYMPNGNEGSYTRPPGPYSPEFALIGVLRTINVGDMWNYGENRKEPPKWFEIGTNITEIFECSLRFVAHNYTSGISSNGSEIHINNTKVIPLADGMFHEYDDTRGIFFPNETYFATFNTPQLPKFSISIPDLGALGSLFTGPRFSGGTFDGSKAPPASGLGVALKNANITATFEQLARSMTHQLHSGGYQGAQVKQGKGDKHDIFVRVVWVWFTVPVLIHLAASLLLLRTMFHACDSGRELWKSSAVALLYHEVVPGHETEHIFRSDVKATKKLDKLAQSLSISYTD